MRENAEIVNYDIENLTMLIGIEASKAGATWAHAGVIEDYNQPSVLDRRIRGCAKLIKQGKLSLKTLTSACNNHNSTYSDKVLHLLNRSSFVSRRPGSG